MSETPTFQAHIDQIRQTIPPQVQLIAVTKYVTATEIRAAYHAGLRDFGESRIQDAQIKIDSLKDLPDIQWHLIGHLQSNKAKQAIELFDWIHSVDSLKIATRLNRLAEEHNKIPKVCLQVKIRPDPNKFGWAPEELLADLPHLNDLKHLNIKGLMAILPQGLNSVEILEAFKSVKQLATNIENHATFPLPLPELSMGMSQDYPLAIEAGSTMVRLGTILFPALFS